MKGSSYDPSLKPKKKKKKALEKIKRMQEKWAENYYCDINYYNHEWIGVFITTVM